MAPRRTEPLRVLFAFGLIVVGGEETEVRLLAKHTARHRFALSVVACQRRDGMTDQSVEQFAALGVDVDTAPYSLSFEDTVAYLAAKFAGYDVIVSCQAPPDV
ncbi:hypothetical protein BH18CHL2_BH18CHL2_06750 [soil metagenome]